jgi:ABC-type multidrug transport system ATPase subunit
MKKLLLSLLILISFTAKSQIKYPSFYIKNGDTLGVIISLQQAQEIDNTLDVLAILKRSKVSYDKLDSAYIQVVAETGKQIAELKVRVTKSDELIALDKVEIKNLKDQIDKYESDRKLSDIQINNQKAIISNDEKVIRKMKTQRFLGFTIGGGSLIGVIVLLLLHK